MNCSRSFTEEEGSGERMLGVARARLTSSEASEAGESGCGGERSADPTGGEEEAGGGCRNPFMFGALADQGMDAGSRAGAFGGVGEDPSAERRGGGGGGVGEVLSAGRNSSRATGGGSEGRAWVPGKQYSVVPGQMYFMSIRSTERLQQLEEWQRQTAVEVNCVFVSLKPYLEYLPFCADFGPLSMGSMSKFFTFLTPALADAQASGKRLVLYTDSRPHNRTNAATLIGSYLVLERGYTAHDAWQPFHFTTRSPFLSYRDASFEPVSFSVSPLDVLEGLERAKTCGVFDMAGFDHDFYEHCQEPATADCTEVVPGRFVAFKGPQRHRSFSVAEGYVCLKPSDYFDIFRRMGVTTIVRLNEMSYDARDFTDAGFEHHECYFPDCTTPQEDVLDKFFAVCREAKGVMAIHCKAGLGRTGVLIGAWLMRKYGFTGRQAIGYCRVMRPGTILGLQQEFLDDNQDYMWQLGDPDVPRDEAVVLSRPLSAEAAPRDEPQGSPWGPVRPRCESLEGDLCQRNGSPLKPGPLLATMQRKSNDKYMASRPPPGDTSLSNASSAAPSSGWKDSFGRRSSLSTNGSFGRRNSLTTYGDSFGRNSVSLGAHHESFDSLAGNAGSFGRRASLTANNDSFGRRHSLTADVDSMGHNSIGLTVPPPHHASVDAAGLEFGPLERRGSLTLRDDSFGRRSRLLWENPWSGSDTGASSEGGGSVLTRTGSSGSEAASAGSACASMGAYGPAPGNGGGGAAKGELEAVEEGGCGHSSTSQESDHGGDARKPPGAAAAGASRGRAGRGMRRQIQWGSSKGGAGGAGGGAARRVLPRDETPTPKLMHRQVPATEVERRVRENTASVERRAGQMLRRHHPRGPGGGGCDARAGRRAVVPPSPDVGCCLPLPPSPTWTRTSSGGLSLDLTEESGATGTASPRSAEGGASASAEGGSLGGGSVEEEELVQGGPRRGACVGEGSAEKPKGPQGEPKGWSAARFPRGDGASPPRYKSPEIESIEQLREMDAKFQQMCEDGSG